MKDSAPDRVFNTVTYTFLILAALVVLYPLIYIVSASFSQASDVADGNVVFLPVNPTLDGYRAVLRDNRIGLGFLNSGFYAVVGTAANVTITIMAAYPLSRRDFRGRGIFTAIFVFTMFFRGGLVPLYLLVDSLGMINTRWAMILPHVMSVWFVIITRTFFNQNIPDELLEAAKLDGCRSSRFIVQVVVPLSAPIIAVLTLWYGVMHWNSYFNALIYLTNPRLFPLQLVLRSILLLNATREGLLLQEVADLQRLEELRGLSELLKYSLIVVAMAPVIVVYPFVQRYFVKGVLVGALKA